MEWYLPFTIIPGIGLVILSTSNILLNLNSEIPILKNEIEKYAEIVNLKLNQMRRLSWSITLQYVGLFFFLVSGLISALFRDTDFLAICILIAGACFIGVAIVLLILFSFRSVRIRQMHLKM